MKQDAVFFMVILMVLLSGVFTKLLPQEKDTVKGTEIKVQEPQSTTTTAIESHAPSTGKIIKGTTGTPESSTAGSPVMPTGEFKAPTKLLPQEKDTLKGAEIKTQEPQSTTTTAIEFQTPSTGKIVEGTTSTPGSTAVGSQVAPTGESKAPTKEMGEEEKAKMEELKTRFKELVGEEMKRFGVMEESLPGGVPQEKTEVPAEEKKATEGVEVPKEVAVEKKEGEVVPQPQEGEKVPGEEKGEKEAKEEVLEEETVGKEEPVEVVEPVPAEPEKPQGGGEKIALDFQDAELTEVITALAEIIGINYIVDPKVKGKVSIHTSGEISKEDVLPILETIFEVNDVTAVKVGNIYKIIPAKDAEKQPLIPRRGKELGDISSPDRLILQIVPLRYIPSKEIEKILKPFLGRGGDIVEFTDRNILVIVDTISNMKKLMELVDTVDVSIFDTVQVKIYELENADAKDLAKELGDLFKALGLESQGKKGDLLSFIPIERMNIILAASSLPDVFYKIDEWVKKLDEVSGAEEQIFIYFVENQKATDLGDIISELYGGGGRKGEREKKTKRTERGKKGERAKTSKKASTSKASTSKTSVEGLTGEITIVVDEINNAIIMRATPQDYAQVLKTIKLLDTVPKQVLIEVLIAEVTLDENTEFGIEWSLSTDYASLGGYKGTERVGQDLGLGGLALDLAKPIAQPGFTYAFASRELMAFLKAYARENKVNILSSPHILAADNTEATIEVGKEVPIVTSEYTPTTLQTATESYSRSIEYRDTGILLSVTPRINEKGLVSIELSQEVSDVSEQRIEGINSPVILKRQAETTLVVQDGNTIAIGGLIRDKKDNTMEGIPILSKIPYLGKAFSYTKVVGEKTELLILITPHVIQSFEEADLVTSEFKEKMEGLKKMLQK